MTPYQANHNPSRSISESRFRRHAIGVIGVGLLLAGIALWIWPPKAASTSFLHGSFVKVGLVLVVTWIAFPKLDQMPIAFVGAILAIMLLIALRPAIIPGILRIALLLSPIFALIWLLRSKPRSN